MSGPHPPTDEDFNALEGTLKRLLDQFAALGHATYDFSNQDVVNENMCVLRSTCPFVAC
jgi:hypothetical protein